MKIEQLEKETEGENIFYWFSFLCFHSENIHSVKNQLDIFKFNFDSFHLCVSECGHLCKKWNFLFEFDEVWSWERFYRCVTAWKRDLAPRSAIKLSIQWPLPPSSAISSQEYLIAIPLDLDHKIIWWIFRKYLYFF